MTLEVAYFVHDLSDAAVSKRVRMLILGGASVTVVGFRRTAEAPDKLHGAAVVDLGLTRDAALISRALSVGKVLLAPKALNGLVRGADVIIARNLEMLALARRYQRKSGSGAALIYECLDIHRMLLSRSAAGKAIRSIETRLWRHTDRLITSSPAFVRNYFEPRGFKAPIQIVENKVLELSPAERALKSQAATMTPWRIGLFGMLRCRKSFELLADLAAKAEGAVQIVIRGKPSPAVFPDFQALLARSPRIEFGGSYRNPEQLAEIYADVHFAWAIDFYEEGENSSWLLPNRIYEGSYYGAVPLALSSVETGAWLREHKAGVLFEPDDLAKHLNRFFTSLDQVKYEELATAVARIPKVDLVDGVDEAKAFVRLLAGRGEPAVAIALPKTASVLAGPTRLEKAAAVGAATRNSPRVSVIMANYNGASFIGDAIDSVLSQTLVDLELIIADDASSDDSLSIARRYAARDGRVKIAESDRNMGPSATRNRGIEAANGAWIAIMDSDDVIHRARLETLLAAAAEDGADIVADDLSIFYSDGSKSTHGLLNGSYAEAPFWVGATEFIRLNTFYSGGPGLGYLKPLIRADLIQANQLRYNPSLRIGEDYDLILRLLLKGAKYRVYPRQLYYYRKHRGSISHRLSTAAAQAILDADLELQKDFVVPDGALAPALEARIRSVKMTLAFNALIAALKARRLSAAGALLLTRPRLIPLLKEPAFNAMGRLKATISFPVRLRPPLSLHRGSQ